MLKTKSILSKKEVDDDLRISVMSRHTLKNGKTPNPRIKDNFYDIHKPIFAPPLKLIGDYYKKNLPWEKFEREYLNYLDSVYIEVEKLSKDAIENNITLLCIESSPKRCHRRLLAEKCKEISPELEIIIN